jgi:hypothetical protein
MQAYYAPRIQWPRHTREDMEMLRAEWERPDGVIEMIIPNKAWAPDPKSAIIGLVAGAGWAVTLIWLFGMSF